jgi:lipopolysaccharide export system protein LptA
MKYIFNVLIASSLFLFAYPALAQKADKVEIVDADVLEGTKINGKDLKKLIRNVVFRQKGTMMYCDSAYQNVSANSLEAFGNVRIVQGDTVTITGNKGFYDGNTRQAKMRGNVVLVDKTMTLYTEQLDYDMNASLAYYYEGGRILDGDNVLTSQTGYYDTRAKLFTFKKDVTLVNPQYTLKSDTLQYSSNSKIAYFNGPSQIIGKSGTLYSTKEGQYNTITQASTFKGRTKIDYDKYTLTGDSVYYDKKNELGFARSNVELFAKEDSTIIEGDIGRYNGQKGISKVYGNAVMKNIVSNDTLYLTADTLVSIDDTILHTRKLFAYRNVKIFKSDLQGKCDSLLYNFSDSTIYFYRDPILWNSGNQLLADSIHIQMANNKMDKMFLNRNAFVISQDTILNFNQLKGRKMTAYFNKDSKMDRVYIDGNAESLYFALAEGDTVLMGMNKMECSRMVIKFVDNNVNTIRAITTPDAVFIPPHEIEEPARRLKGFNWRDKERPVRRDVLVRYKNKPLSSK